MVPTTPWLAEADGEGGWVAEADAGGGWSFVSVGEGAWAPRLAVKSRNPASNMPFRMPVS